MTVEELLRQWKKDLDGLITNYKEMADSLTKHE